MRSELRRVTWPLPWWVVAVPGLFTALVSFLVVARAEDWAYIALARLSGMPAESLLVTGPLVAVSAAWVGERFLNRNSPLSAPILVRASGAQGVRVLCVLACGWGAAHILGSGAAVILRARDATGGVFYPVEVLLSLCGLWFFIVTGLFLGSAVSRWHAALWAGLWALLWVYLFPVYYPDIVRGGSSNIEYFLFPALPSVDHRRLDAWVMGVVVAWWIAVLAVLAALFVAWFRHVARLSSRALWGASVGACSVAGLGLLLPSVLPAPFVDGVPGPVACSEGRHLKVCVTQEQERMLQSLVPRVDATLDRMGGNLPPELTTVASYHAVHPLESAGLDEASLLVVNVGTAGSPTVEFDIATSLAGLQACAPDSSDPRAVGWAFAFGQWLAPEVTYLSPDDPTLAQLARTDESVVLGWYMDNSQLLRSCAYVGDGPS